MSMHLPNDDVGPTGEEAAEFLAQPVPDDDTAEGDEEESTPVDDA